GVVGGCEQDGQSGVGAAVWQCERTGRIGGSNYFRRSAIIAPIVVAGKSRAGWRNVQSKCGIGEWLLNIELGERGTDRTDKEIFERCALHNEANDEIRVAARLGTRGEVDEGRVAARWARLRGVRDVAMEHRP